MMYKSILVPHAGTKAGDKALEHAEIITKKKKELILPSKKMVLHR